MNKLRLVVVLSIILIVSALMATTIYITRKPTPFPTPIVEKRVSINGTINVNSNDAYYIEFSIPDNAIQIQVIGGFSALNNTTIRVYITTNGNLNPLSSSFKPAYDSGLVNKGNMNVTLHSGGTHFLYYNNYNYLYNYNATTQKVISTEVDLSYMIL